MCFSMRLFHSRSADCATAGEKEADGRRFMGVLRTTGLVGPDGRVENVWEQVQIVRLA